MSPADRKQASAPGKRGQLLALPDAKLLAQCEVDRFRGSGPGGQKRNKTESAIRLRHALTGLSVIATESRSQHKNRARALHRLRARIALDLREAVDLDQYTPPAALTALIARGAGRIGPRIRRSSEYLAGVAALLDLFEAVAYSVRDTARLVDSSTGSLSRLMRADDRVARKANELRSARDLRPLR